MSDIGPSWSASYFFSFISVFRERFQDAVQKYKVTCPCVPRVFLITPVSCKFPAPGTQFQNEKHIGEVEPDVIGLKKYCLQLYELTMKNGKVSEFV